MSHVCLAEGVPERGCHTEGRACYGEICVFPRICEKDLAVLSPEELAIVNQIRKQCDLEPINESR